MNSRSAEIKKIFNEIKKRIHIPNHLEYEAAFESEDNRLLALFDDIFADELFSHDSLSLQELRKATSMEQLTKIIDNFTFILSFYRDNHQIFSRLIEENFFQDYLSQKGPLPVWNELMTHSFKKLNYSQAKTLTLDVISRLHNENVTDEPKCRLSF